MIKRLGKTIVLLLLLLVFVLTISGCTETKYEQETIKIVTSAPMSIDIGQNMVDGIKFAFEEVNYQVGNYKI